jgi:hypothetical protein
MIPIRPTIQPFKHVKIINCKFRAEFFPEYLYREGIASTNYYYLLSKVGIFKKLFLSTVNIVIEKS